MTPDHDSALWCARTKADYLLHKLPVEQIAYLGDGFPWNVTVEDLQLAAEHLSPVQCRALQASHELGLLDGG
ncbi:hypothetical protein SAMN04489806_1105 [Paramicrobacterium humi]|uniref:Uncharacterized protein n=1 Tax=Paramicrobacterium humi TaxID=640635 RepID=A0A1H4KD61_9MICO|nr:hypothetical protein [Microbacterium humi]SEB55988.1 hypothetical protein SAMN04489806_1105 [Microbacterium humi]